jgi:hypothetical protein
MVRRMLLGGGDGLQILGAGLNELNNQRQAADKYDV